MQPMNATSRTWTAEEELELSQLNDGVCTRSGFVGFVAEAYETLESKVPRVVSVIEMGCREELSFYEAISFFIINKRSVTEKNEYNLIVLLSTK